MEDEYVEEESTEEAGTETGEDESAETDGETVEYEVDDDGDPILDADGNPIPKVAEGETDEKEKPDHKKNAQDRIQQLANEKRELADRLARLEAQFSKQEQEKPDFVEVDMASVNAWFEQTTEQIQTYQLEGNYLAAKKLELNQVNVLKDLEANEAKRQAWLDRQKTAKNNEDEGSKILAEVDRAAEFYRDANKIDSAVWDKMGNWFRAQCESDPILGREFAERVETQSKMAAIRWAHEYTTEHMGVDAKKAIDKKNQTKQTASAAAPKAAGGKGTPVDLAKMLEKATEAGTPEAFQEYMAAKRRALGK